MDKALGWMQQEREDYERALMRAPQRMASATIADAHKTYEDFVADELADIRAERAKSQARLEHTARLARAREQGILEAERDWHHSPEHAEACQEDAAPNKAKLKRDFVAEVVERIRAFHAENGKLFDSNCMPGDAGDLLWLMKRRHPDQFEEMGLKAFREHYRAICKWPRAAGQQAGARSLYLEIFPEAKAPLAAAASLFK
ncbi:hypothetical protein MX652_13220 [Thauera aromatica]|nr:hypothetical protein [Thauera aromatica]MCK2127650.1 hypothetical protein [Thauera aromatica]